jgi:hypothetical protein
MNSPQPAVPPRDPAVKAPAWFWFLAILLIAYVAACTEQRDQKADEGTLESVVRGS